MVKRTLVRQCSDNRSFKRSTKALMNVFSPDKEGRFWELHSREVASVVLIDFSRIGELWDVSWERIRMTNSKG